MKIFLGALCVMIIFTFTFTSSLFNAGLLLSLIVMTDPLPPKTTNQQCVVSQ